MTAPHRTHGIKREHVERACAGKNRYADRYTAIAMGITRSQADGIKLFAYQCRICQGWHLTRSGRGRDGNPVIPCVEKVFG